MKDYAALAKEYGFTDAAVMKVSDLVVVPEYREFCRQNLCGNYGVLPACPPASGTVEEMTAAMRSYRNALILTVVLVPVDMQDANEQRQAKRAVNMLTEELMEQMKRDGCGEMLMMGAGPWKNASCMSAYCVDAQKMAGHVGMKCWENDGKVRYFSLILFR